MKRTIFALAALTALLVIAGCSKETDNASKWVGTYTSAGTVYDSINQLTISEVNSTTIMILFQYQTGPFVYTYDTVRGATVSSATSVSFNETDYIHITPGGNYAVSGSGTLGGNNITISGTAQNTALSPPTIFYSFTGSK